MRILVLGQNGMLGHVVYNYFKEKGNEVYGTVYNSEGLVYDAFNNQESLENIIAKIKPEIVINCIGILNKAAEDNHELAVKVNSLLPNYIDRLSTKYNFKFLHVSTDCVFDGKKGKYDEKSYPDAVSFYGRSKALGEINNDRNLTLRTSIVGPDNNPNGIGLFEWFITQNTPISGYSKVIWTGVTTIELAKCMEKALANNLTGLHHVVNNDFIPKYDLLKLFAKYFNKNIEINENNEVISEKTLVRTEKSFDFKVPTYEQMIEEMKDWVLEHQDLYPLILKNTNLGGKTK